MRTVVFGLILLAAGKVWFQDRTYRTAMSDAVVEAYRERAIEVCRLSASKRAPASREIVVAWGPSSAAEPVIGNPDVRVAIWDTENPLWNERYRDLQLVLTSTNTATRCAYDVRRGAATLSLAAR
jgi:hypothetical protein